jgi:phosphoserine aminotransferase
VVGYKDLEGVLLAIVQHWELQGVREARKIEKKYATVIQVTRINSNGYRRIPTYQKWLVHSEDQHHEPFLSIGSCRRSER